MPIESGTLQGYDQLLSISQEAVNSQLITLYRTEIDPPLENGPKFLINHEMHFHTKKTLKNGKVIISRNGLDAYVCCPKVEFGGEGIKEEVDKYRIATIRFKFRPAEPWEIDEEDIKKGKSRNSVFVYREISGQDDEGNDLYEYPEININGWEISWQAVIDRANIQDILSEIIDPAKKPDSNIVMSKEARESLEKVSSSNFQVSTIFCAMQSARLIQSFKLRDQNGNIPENATKTNGDPVSVKELISDFQNILVGLFTPNENNPLSKGTKPTPDNPFVLGYTVSQKTASVDLTNNTNKDAVKTPTPTYFVPKTFRCNLSPKSDFCDGTLNYCMLTHRAYEPPYHQTWTTGKMRVIDDGVDGAGRFRENVFSRLKSKAKPGSTEGALFFCQDIFVNHWIGSAVAPLFCPDPFAVTSNIAKLIREKYTFANVAGSLSFSGDTKSPEKYISRNNEYWINNKFDTGRSIINENALDDPTESVKLSYDTSVSVKYENLNDLQPQDDDMKRRLKFTISSNMHVTIKIYRRLATSHVGMAFKETGSAIGELFGAHRMDIDYKDDCHWEDSCVSDVWLNYKYTFEIGTSPGNRGTFSVENPVSHHLNSNGDLISYANRNPDYTGAPGLWHNTELKNWAKTFSFAFGPELSSLSDIQSNLAKDGASIFAGAVKSLVDSLGTTVVLPAGDVFMFKGMSADADNNVFTTICYDTPIGGEVKQQIGEDVSFNRWETPKKPEAKK